MLEDIERKDYAWCGIDPEKAIEIAESREEARRDLSIIMSALTPTQQKVLSLSDYTVRQISDMTGMDVSLVVRTRQSIPKRLNRIVNENRINTLRKRNKEELQKALAVREAMKSLYVLLIPPQSTKEMTGSVDQPAFSFERFKEVGMGMKEGILDGKKVMKPISKCFLNEYFRDTFHDDCTICTLCQKCKYN